MARLAPTLNSDISFDFKQIKQRFFDLNKSRLKRTMADLREDVDMLENLIPRKLWPVPTYADLLFKL